MTDWAIIGNKTKKIEEGTALIDLDDTIHSYILGASRSGKTNFMIGYGKALLDHAMIVIDPGGTLAPQIASLSPPERLTFVDRDHPLVINPLRRKYLNKSDKVKEITSVVNASVKVLNPNQVDITVKMEKIIRRAVTMFEDAHLSLDYLSEFLEDWQVRADFFKKKPKTRFWELFDTTDTRDRKERDDNRATGGRITDRLSLLYEDENLSPFILGEDQLDLFDITENKKVLCFDLSDFYEEDMAYIGNLITYGIRSFATKVKEGYPYRLTVLIDEFHYFVNEAFGNTLTSCLKKNIGFCLSHHSHSQIRPGLIDIALDNSQMLVITKAGKREAERMADKYGIPDKELLKVNKPFAYLSLNGKPYLVEMDRYDVPAYKPEANSEIPNKPLNFLRDEWIEVYPLP